MNKKIFLLTPFIILAFSANVFAQTDTSSSITEASKPNSSASTGAASITKNALKDNLALPTGITKNNIKDGLKPEIAEFRNKIAEIKDQKKKVLAEKIVNKITTVNSNRTDKMTKALDMLSLYIQKHKEKAANLKASGKDTKNFDTAVLEAERLINEARTKVNTQAAKTYSTNITETTLKANIGGMVSSFRLELQAVHKAIVDAKQAVMKVRSELAKITGEGKNSATDSAIIQ